MFAWDVLVCVGRAVVVWCAEVIMLNIRDGMRAHLPFLERREGIGRASPS